MGDSGSVGSGNGAIPPPSIVFSEVASMFSSSRFVSEGTSVKPSHVPGQSPLGKTLYEQLKENKDKKEELFREQSRFKGPKALDEDEVQFLTEQETLAKVKKLEAEIEESRQLEDFYEKKKKAQQAIVKPAIEISLPPIQIPSSLPSKLSTPTSTAKKPLIKVVTVSTSSSVSPSSTKKRKDDSPPSETETDPKRTKLSSATTTTVAKEEEDVGFKLVDYGDDEVED